MNWRCDVYTYEDVGGGWTTHVAGRRRVIRPIPDMPLQWIPLFGGVWSKEDRCMMYPSRWHRLASRAFGRVWHFWHYRVHMRSLDLIPLRPIGLEFDGESFNDPTPGECASRLEWLRRLGYVVPQFAIDALKAEEADGAVVGVEA